MSLVSASLVVNICLCLWTMGQDAFTTWFQALGTCLIIKTIGSRRRSPTAVVALVGSGFFYICISVVVHTFCVSPLLNLSEVVFLSMGPDIIGHSLTFHPNL